VLTLYSLLIARTLGSVSPEAGTGRGGYWIETCSGPPYFVATPPAPRFRNSG
jgi:hypothetical protein